VVIAPLRSGGGTRLKILEAMAYGRPVVSTSLGAEGLQVEDGSEILIADRPDRFAECVLSLVNDDGIHQRQAEAARRAAESRYDWNRIAERLLELYQRIGKR
jgi:glycosyltransferase involved in cell wall biosynthesis